jgi:hypothetical protein
MIDNGDGTVTDPSTGLMWQQATPDNLVTWEQAVAYCADLNLGGYTDWRLPMIQELNKIVDYSRFKAAIDDRYFTNTAVSRYWSSSTYVNFTSSAWGVHFGTGSVNHYVKSLTGNVRAVRGIAWIPSQSAKVPE